MKILISTRSASGVHSSKLTSFAQGVTVCGDEAVLDTDDSQNCDLAVIYGSVKPHRGRAEQVAKTKIVKQFKKFVQIETQLVGRRMNADADEFRVGVDGFMWDTADWGFAHTDQQRTKHFFNRFDYPKREQWNTAGEHILICMQKYGDASLGTVDTYAWCMDTVTELRKHTDRKIVVRPHPIYRKKDLMEQLRTTLLRLPNVEWRNTDIKEHGEPDIAQDLENCWCTVTYTSGSAVDSVLQGVPNIAMGTGNMAWPVSSHSLSDIENPHRGDKTDWLNKLALCQWSTKEFNSGECWKHIKKSL
jgi:hypothetical protein